MAKFSHNVRLGILGLEIQPSTSNDSLRAKIFYDLRSFSLKLQETLIFHIRQESQVMRELKSSLKIQETPHNIVESLVS